MKFLIFYHFYSIISLSLLKINANSNIISNDTIIVIIKNDLIINFINFKETSLYSKNFVLLINSTLFRKNIEENVIKKSMSPSTLRLVVPEEDINQKFLHSINYKNNFKIMTYFSNSDLNIQKFMYLFRNKKVKFIFFITNVNQQVELFRILIKGIKTPYSILNLNRINSYNFDTYDRIKVSV